VGQVIIRKGDIVGAVVIVSPTDAARGRVRQAWMLLCGICVSALGGVVVLTRLLARSVSGPVQVLGETTARIRGGELQARAPAETGPPELRHLAESFNSMAEHMQVVIETQDQSMANASHQLRNPLTALLMRLERLSLVADVTDSEHGEDDAGQTRVSAAADALDEGRHLAGTLDDMLALARADHAQRPGGEVNVAEVADQRMEVWSLVAEKREVRLMRTGVQHAVGRHDGESLGGALDAVIDNALKFSGAGSTVTVDIATSPTHVTVTVSDEGPGLQPAEWARVTDRFWRGRRHPNVAGSGLGMSIAATLMKRHGGTLAVRAAPSGGLQVDMTVEKV
jgi:signal transduction histidine kinase